MNETEFHALADKTLNFLYDLLEKLDEQGMIDMEYEAGVMTIMLQNGKQFVVSKHAPTQQLWLSSPVSGGLHFSFFPSPIRGEAGRGAEYAHTYPISRILSNARDLRKNLTDTEKLLWQLLRGEQLGVKFRKQHPVGNYIADFACLDPKLIIELDRGQHNEESNVKKDAARTAFLEEQGFKVVRFWNNEVSENIEGVLETIYAAITQESPHPNPPPKGEGIKWALADGRTLAGVIAAELQSFNIRAAF